TALDVIVTDQRMPNMTGVQLLERVQAQGLDVAGIVLTAYTDSPAIIAAINRARAFRFLTKPWRAEEVLAVLTQASQQVYQRRAILRLVGQLNQRNVQLQTTLDDLRATQQHLLHLERQGTIGRLTAGILHDLRNLLQRLSFLDEELDDQALDAETREIIRIGVAGLRTLHDTLSTLNAFARAGKLTATLVQAHLRDVVHDVLAVLSMDKQLRQRDLVVDVQPELPPLSCDRRLLTQALINLVDNAIQATERGQHLRIEVARRTGEGFVLAVEDDGPGVAADLLERLFTAFATTKGERGLGMGLYMARLVAEAHGGSIGYRRSSLGGARFEILL
ncbi:MAG: HAMP domain-containing histidine kinase, partial [Deltaproteobacteria bacterium]|nr:HAMP domain-containing histidine kinase [Deltaproteobacteria bacterium]